MKNPERGAFFAIIVLLFIIVLLLFFIFRLRAGDAHRPNGVTGLGSSGPNSIVRDIPASVLVTFVTQANGGTYGNVYVTVTLDHPAAAGETVTINYNLVDDPKYVTQPVTFQQGQYTCTVLADQKVFNQITTDVEIEVDVDGAYAQNTASFIATVSTPGADRNNLAPVAARDNDIVGIEIKPALIDFTKPNPPQQSVVILRNGVPDAQLPLDVVYRQYPEKTSTGPDVTDTNFAIPNKSLGYSQSVPVKVYDEPKSKKRDQKVRVIVQDKSGKKLGYAMMYIIVPK